VSYHKASAVTHSASRFIALDIKPTRKIDSYRCSGARSIRISADDLRFGMVFIYLFSDTVARGHEAIDSTTWSPQVQGKCGVCHGSLIIVDGPIDKAAEFDDIVNNWVHDMEHFMDQTLRAKTNLLPGRSFSVIHERNSQRFKDSSGGQRSVIILKKGGRLKLEKDVITGIYHLDIFV
tara:strand:- start:1202 stop:1735 length:534 start_codon:yes stop_codon:yes gene_type:complete